MSPFVVPSSLKETAEKLSDPNGPFGLVVQKSITGSDAHSKLFGEVLTQYRKQMNDLLETIVDEGVDAAKKKHGPDFLSTLEKLMQASIDDDVAKIAGKEAVSQGQRELLNILKRFHDLFGE